MPIELPININCFYKGKGWTCWEDLLNTDKLFLFKKKYFLSYNEAKKWLFENKITETVNSQRKWFKYIKGNSNLIINKNIPKSPANIYKSRKEWGSWSDFLNSGYIATRKRKYISYIEAREWVKNNLSEYNIRLCKNWWSYLRGEINNAPELIKTIPHKPNVYYKNKGWISWRHFLNNVNGYSNKYTFKESRKWIRKNLNKFNLKTEKDWILYNKNKTEPVKPDKIPLYADDVYRKKGWKGWKHFFMLQQ